MIETCACCGSFLPAELLICPGCESKEGRKTVKDKKKAILDYLREYHVGKYNAVHCRELENIFKLDDRAVRRKISALRQEGYPICSGDMGYYYAESQKEINSTIHRLNDMLTGVANARTGLMYAPRNEPVVTIEVTFKMNGGVA